MSHFTVAVFSHAPSEVDELLAPYNEDVDKDSPYAAFKESEYGELDPDTQKTGYWCNPNAKWDWWCIGGRWSGMLTLKQGYLGLYEHLTEEEKKKQLQQGVCDQARVKKFVFPDNLKARRVAERVWEIAVEGSPLREGESPITYGLLFKKEYYLTQYGTKERYMDYETKFLPYAILTADGEWLATGDMGWWGMDNATRESRDSYVNQFDEYLKKAQEENLFITIVDCHI
jgi:hypothetical protein